jgi:hypothetical protein
MTSSSSKTDGAKAFAAWHNHGLTNKHPKRRLSLSQTIKRLPSQRGERPDRNPIPEERGAESGGRAPSNDQT